MPKNTDRSISRSVRLAAVTAFIFAALAPRAVSQAAVKPAAVYVTGDTAIAMRYDPAAGADRPDDYKMVRYGARFAYYFALPNGAYTVSVGVAEFKDFVAGRRIFSVIANGREVVKDLDIFSEVGGNQADVKSFRVEVKDGELTLAFGASKDNAMFAYIDVKGANASYRLVAGSPEDQALAGRAGIYPDRLRYDPETGVIHNGHLESGLPLGGIGCGKLELYSTGAISQGTFNNNAEFPIKQMNGCFAAVWMNAGGRTTARALQLTSPYALPAVGGIDFRGLYPQALVSYRDAQLPADLSLRAYSPLIPHDIRNSSLPVALFVFTVTNQSRGPVDVSVALSWENLIGVGGNAISKAFSDRDGNRVSPIVAPVGMAGMAFEGPEKAKSPDDRLRYNAQGNYALIAQLVAPDAKATTAGWDANAKTVSWWDRFAVDGSVAGTVEPGQEWARHPAGVVAVRVSLKDKETREIPFAVAWYTPRYYVSSGAEYGHLYEKSFKSSEEVARYALENRLNLLALTQEWQDRFLNSTLPRWLSRKLVNDAYTLTSNSLLTRDSGLGGTKPGPSLYATLNSPGDLGGAIGAMDERTAGHEALAALFPTLDLTELTQFALSQAPSGEIARYTGNSCVAIGGTQGAETPGARTDGPELVCGYAYQMARYYFWTGDQAFLDRFYPSVKHAIEHAITLDKDGDGIPEGWTSFDALDQQGAFSYTAVMWLGALRASEQLASAIQDRPFAARCAALYEKARRSTMSLLWTGAYLRKWAVPDTGGLKPGEPPAPSSRDNHLFALSLAGQWMADQLDAGDLLPAETLDKTIATMTAANDARSRLAPPILAAPENTWEVDWRSWPSYSEAYQAAVYAAHGQADAGLTILDNVDYLALQQARVPWAAPLSFNAQRGYFEPWGTEYRYSASTNSASWAFLTALEGFSMDLAAGRIVLTPNVPTEWKRLAAPIFAPTYWAWVDYRIGTESRKISFRLDRMTPVALASVGTVPNRPPGLQTGAALIIRDFVLPGPAAGTPQVTALVARAPAQGKVGRDARGRLTYTFASPVTLNAGQTIEFEIR